MTNAIPDLVQTNQCLHDLFESAAARAGDVSAIRSEGGEISYAELDARANQLANHLLERGVGLESIVAISMPRSADAIVAILGVLKAGAAFLPLDPTYPAERIRFCLADAAPVAILTTSAHRALFAGRDAVICLDDAETRAAIGGESVAAPPRRVTGRHLAYVIYTSGSTGTPKGVLIEHRGAANLGEVEAQIYQVAAGSRMLQFASLSFDASVSEMVTTFAAGATLCLYPRDQIVPGPPLLELLRRERINCVMLPPSVMAMMDPVDLPDLRTVVSCGEACRPGLPTRWGTGRLFVNAYGPTECTVCVTAGEVTEACPQAIGAPIRDMYVHLLDEERRPVPAGTVGEIYVSGVGLARGYLNRPELTAERFVTVDHLPGVRLYRTGDRARWREDGQLEFLGRADEQVKIAGFRIEPGEIEAALSTHPLVKQCLVVAGELVPGRSHLLAYFVPQSPKPIAAGVFRSYLSERLPYYMVPSWYVRMDELPLSANGKLDRKALPLPTGNRQEQSEDYVPPADEIEFRIAQVWEEMLGIRPIGMNDNYFELGGSSLLVARLLTQIEKQLGRSPSIAEFASSATIRGIAELLRGQGRLRPG